MVETGAATQAIRRIESDGRGQRSLAQQICRACIVGLDVDGAGLSVLTGRASRTTLWASDSTALQLEDLQFSLNEGACMDAAATGRPVLIPDLHDTADTGRWPMFADAVNQLTTVRALFALPLQWGAVNLGVIDLYRTEPGGLSAEQHRDALTAADNAALLILDQSTDPSGALGWLDPSAGHRAEIHQATGMVAAQLEVGVTEALARLRAHAFVEQRRLIDVAHDVVARRIRFDEK